MARGPLKKVTIKALAESLGLSRNTVAKAIKNDSIINIKTRQIVIDKCVEMGYYGKKVALPQLNEPDTERSQCLLVLSLEETTHFWGTIMFGISTELKKNNMNLLFHSVSYEEQEVAILPQEALLKSVDGIICTNLFTNVYMEALQEVSKPVVFLDIPILKCGQRIKGDCLIIAGECSTYEVTRKLLEKNLWKIGFIGDIHYSTSIMERWIGFVNALNAYNCVPEAAFCITNPEKDHYYEFETLKQAFNKLSELPSAFVCCNDLIASFVLQILKEKGLENSIVVTGFDGTHRHLNPKMITVNVDTNKIGVKLAQMIIWRLSNPSMPYETIHVYNSINLQGEIKDD